MTIVDANVLLDVVTQDSVWAQWSKGALASAAQDGPLLLNGIIYAELATRYQTIDLLDEFIEGTGLEVVEMPRQALFEAAKAYKRYRQIGGTKTGVLPDFFIGAHASVLGAPLLTRDVKRFRTYFPAVELITPNRT